MMAAKRMFPPRAVGDVFGDDYDLEFKLRDGVAAGSTDVCSAAKPK